MRGVLSATVWDRYTQDIVYCLTLTTCALMWGKHPKTVQRAIDTGALFAAKSDGEPGKPGGVWHISYSSAVDLWGQPTHNVEICYNVVEPR